MLVTLQNRPELFQVETRRALQRRLATREFYSGPIDGEFGPSTNRGLRKAFGLEE